MTRKILVGFGVDVDAVAGWCVAFCSWMIRVSNGDYDAGLDPMEEKIRHWTSLEYARINAI
jgi:hypothetical protein